MESGEMTMPLIFECWTSVESAAVYAHRPSLPYDPDHTNHALGKGERPVETGGKIVMVVKSSLAGRTSALRFESALFI